MSDEKNMRLPTWLWLGIIAALMSAEFTVSIWAIDHFESIGDASYTTARVDSLQQSVDELRINLAVAMRDQGLSYQNTAPRRPAGH